MKAQHSLQDLCANLVVSRGGYYRWHQAQANPRPRARQDPALAATVRTLHAGSRLTYGSPRIVAALRAQGSLDRRGCLECRQHFGKVLPRDWVHGTEDGSTESFTFAEAFPCSCRQTRPLAARYPVRPAKALLAARASKEAGTLVPNVRAATPPAMAPSVALVAACSQSMSRWFHRSEAMLNPPPATAPMASPNINCGNCPFESTAWSALFPTNPYWFNPPASPNGSRLSQRCSAGS